MDRADAFFYGFLLGVFLIASAVVVPIVLTQPPPHQLLRRTGEGLVCKHDRYYPQADCKAMAAAAGPRLSSLKVKP